MDLADLPTFEQIIRQAMALDAEVFAAIQTAPNGLWVALGVVLLAGFSESLGQSVVLLLNQIKPKRFGLAVAIAALSHLAGYVLWAAVVWLIGTYLFGRTLPFVALASAVGLAYAPQILGFFVLIPFLGNGIGVLLSIWSLLAIITAIRTGLDLDLWQAIIASGLGWILVQLWRRTLGRPIYAIGRWMENHAAGVPMTITWDNLPDVRRRRPSFLEAEFMEELRSRLGKSTQSAVHSVNQTISHMEKRVEASTQELRKLGKQRPG